MRTLHDRIGGSHLLPSQRGQPERHVAVGALSRPRADAGIGAAAITDVPLIRALAQVWLSLAACSQPFPERCQSQAFLHPSLTMLCYHDHARMTRVIELLQVSRPLQCGAFTLFNPDCDVACPRSSHPLHAGAPDDRPVARRFLGGVHLLVRVDLRRHARQRPQVARQGDDAGAGLVAGPAELHLHGERHGLGSECTAALECSHR